MGLFRVNYNKQSDEQLVRLMAKGDERAFDMIYQRYGAKLAYFFTRKLKHDKEKGEDFMHDLFAKLIDRPELFDSSRSFKTWIYSVANNMCINEYKKMAVRSNTINGLSPEIQVSSDNQPLEDQLNEKNFSSDLEKAMSKLDEKHREVFVMRHIDGLSVKEVAEVMNINEGTVKSRLFYATKKIAGVLQMYNPVNKD
ncbi:RNA polymerase sigma factor [Brumimicrobium aurantiacum]|uniref:RNA polymerase sigma factor n=1 Tax=Brumimicrobium aurantiacum TaxID=1737063 RepID=A0A3E1EWC1_9FLAO|nr:RNA polymerase sigma factor [Brumimicrobium aurantiacum]RFC53793.1 RNA polymerase sigma factor [Brumimicrobium aurantiacum]